MAINEDFSLLKKQTKSLSVFNFPPKLFAILSISVSAEDLREESQLDDSSDSLHSSNLLDSQFSLDSLLLKCVSDRDIKDRKSF